MRSYMQTSEIKRQQKSNSQWHPEATPSNEKTLVCNSFMSE